MIDRQEIMELAKEFGLTPTVVEKDYVLGWFLAGVFSHPALRSDWVFKGGTCLKKCYFETYRFSEDLDFTLANPGHLDDQFLTNTFAEVTEWVYENSGIEMPSGTIRFEIYTNPRGQSAGQGRVGYRGPLQPRGDLPRIKLDLTVDEQLVLEPTFREVHHPYSDRPEDGIQAQCYCYEELFAEKLRALGERERPRDLYDVIHLYRQGYVTSERALIVSVLKEKCAFRGIAVPTVEALEGKPERIELETEWKNMLAHQLPELPPFEQFWNELPRVFEWLYETVPLVAAQSYPVGEAIDLTWQPPSMAHAWGFSAPLEVIRFAAANHLCVDLRYNGTHRLIEPYSLRRTREGNILLHAIRHDSNEHRAYRVDRIEGASATRAVFI